MSLAEVLSGSHGDVPADTPSLDQGTLLLDEGVICCYYLKTSTLQKRFRFLITDM